MDTQTPASRPAPKTGQTESGEDGTDQSEGRPQRDYWRDNIRLLAVLFTIWFLVSFGAGILFRDALDRFQFAGYPLGFWFAQQGAIYVFVVLIFIYVARMRRLERKYDLDD